MNTNTQNFPTAPQLTVTQALQRAHAHWDAGQAHQAEQLCMRVLQVAPQQPEALHLLGLMAHAYSKLDMAIDFLRRACSTPGVPAVYFSNLAEMCRQKGLLAEAEQAAQRAVALAPGMAAAWGNLGIILQESGKLGASLECLQKVVALQPDSPEAHNNLANTYQRLNQLALAQQSYQHALALHPAYAEAHSNLAFLLNELGQFDAAAASGQRAIEYNPQLVDAYLNLAEIETSRSRHDRALHWLHALAAFAPNHPGGLAASAHVLAKLGRHVEALACAQAAVAAAPGNANAQFTLGQMLHAAGQHAAALPHFDQAATLPGNVAEDALVARATALLETGDKDAAIAAFDYALQRFPQSSKAMAARADTRTYHAADPDILAMQAALTREIKPGLGEAMALHFALGKAWLDVGDSVQAFTHLDQGNALKRTTFHYDAARTAQWLQRIGETFTPALLQQWQGAGVASELPLFIIGMPRSGTTLIEQILASHPQVYGAGELSALRLSVETHGVFPDSVAGLSAATLQQMGADYLAQITPLAPAAARIVDKMPANFFYAGLIPLILPDARIIHCRRDPVDTCLSCYSKLFSGEQAFAYQQDELGQFYQGYQALMTQLKPVLPPTHFIEVDYEAVVGDLEGQARRLIDFAGLPWDDACLNFHQTPRVVHTASAAQVRQPVYTTSRGRWHQHAAQLAPLLAALGIAA